MRASALLFVGLLSGLALVACSASDDSDVSGELRRLLGMDDSGGDEYVPLEQLPPLAPREAAFQSRIVELVDIARAVDDEFIDQIPEQFGGRLGDAGWDSEERRSLTEWARRSAALRALRQAIETFTQWPNIDQETFHDMSAKTLHARLMRELLAMHVDLAHHQIALRGKADAILRRALDGEVVDETMLETVGGQ